MTMPSAPDPLTQPSELNLQELLDVLQRRKAVFAQVFCVVLAAGLAASFMGKALYVTTAKLLVPSGSPMLSIIDSNNPIAALMVAMQPDSISTQLQDLQAGKTVAKARQELHLVSRPEVAAPSVRFDQLPESNIIEVTVEGGDPKEIAALANRIVDLHAADAAEKTTGGITQTKGFVQHELEQQEKKLEDAERRLLQFRQANQIPQRTSSQDAQVGEQAALLSRVIESESNLTTAKAQVKELQAELEKQPGILVQESVKENPRVARLQDKLDDLSLQREDLLAQYTPSSRPVRDLDRQILRLQRRLAAEPKEVRLQSHSPNPARQSLQARLDELRATLHGYEENHSAALAQFRARKSVGVNQETWEADLSKLTRDRDAIQSACTMLSDRLRDLEIRSHAQFRSPARVIGYAGVPTSPIPSRRGVNITLSALLAFLLASGTVLLQEYMDDRVNAPEEVERLAGLPALAHVPLMPQDQPRIVTSLSRRSPVVEAYRSLRSSIGFAGIDAPIRRLQITSASKGEGKSTTAANLAIAMAMDRKRVILIDADLRSPMVHRLLHRVASPGLSELLAEMNTLGEALQPTEVEGLQVIASGAIPPNPAELLGSATLDRLLEQLEKQADVIILDTPPCVPVADPLIVAARMDAVVLVLKVAHSRKGALRQTVELLGRARARVIGTVFNQVDASRRGSYYYRQYNQYGQGYYAEAEQSEGSPRRNGKRPKSVEKPRSLVAPSRAPDEDE